MEDLTLNKVRRNLCSENEIGPHQDVALLELDVMDKAKSGILKNGNVLSAQERAIMQIDRSGKMVEFYRAVSKMPQHRKKLRNR